MFVKFQLSGSNSFLDMSGSQIYSRGSCARYKPLAEKNFTPDKSILYYLRACDISTFYLY